MYDSITIINSNHVNMNSNWEKQNEKKNHVTLKVDFKISL